MEARTQTQLRCIRTDYGGEYTGKKFDAFCAAQGIVHQTSASYSLAQNGLAKRTS